MQIEGGNQSVEFPLELSYFSVLLFMLGVISEDKNYATENSC